MINPKLCIKKNGRLIAVGVVPSDNQKIRSAEYTDGKENLRRQKSTGNRRYRLYGQNTGKTFTCWRRWRT